MLYDLSDMSIDGEMLAKRWPLVGQQFDRLTAESVGHKVYFYHRKVSLDWPSFWKADALFFDVLRF